MMVIFRTTCWTLVVSIALLLVPTIGVAQGLPPSSLKTDKANGEIYGFVMADVGFNGGTIDPDWYDVVRPTKLPSYEGQFGADGRMYFSARQTRFGTKFWQPTEKDDIRGIFEFELFGVGADAGQTTFRLRHAYLQYGKFGAGQYWSAFMDIGVFPNTVEYWGPSGMVFYRNLQLRFMPVMGDKHNLTISLENPGASADEGDYNSYLSSREIYDRYPLPDLAVQYRLMGSKGYLQLAGIVRNIQWDDVNSDDLDLSGSETGYGINVSTNIQAGPGTIKGSFVYGKGIENYMNDATADLALIPNATDPDDPDLPPGGIKLVPVMGIVLFYDWNWNDTWTSAAGFSTLNQDLDGTASDASAFESGSYALANVIYNPAPPLMAALELQYGGRKNLSDGYEYDAFRIQFSCKYSFNFRVGG